MKGGNGKFHWPLWALPLTIVLSVIINPYVGDRMEDARSRIMTCGYLAISIRYLWAWRKTGSKTDWIVYTALTMLTPLIAHIICKV